MGQGLLPSWTGEMPEPRLQQQALNEVVSFEPFATPLTRSWVDGTERISCPRSGALHPLGSKCRSVVVHLGHASAPCASLRSGRMRAMAHTMQ